MRKYRNVLKQHRQVIAVICDICQREYDDPTEVQEFVFIDKECGYGSIFGDNTLLELDICQHCFRDNFKDKIRIIDAPDVDIDIPL